MVICLKPDLFWPGSLNKDKREVIPSPIGLSIGINLKTVVPCCFKYINAACLHERPDPHLLLFSILRLTRSLGLTRWSGGAFRTGGQGCHGKGLVIAPMISLTFEPDCCLGKGLAFGAV